MNGIVLKWQDNTDKFICYNFTDGCDSMSIFNSRDMLFWSTRFAIRLNIWASMWNDLSVVKV